MQRQTLPLRPRTNTLIVGPSGSGKTHLVHTVAEDLGARFIALSTSEWIPLGCSGRGAANTWPLIFRFLKKNHAAEGLVVLLDEIDKIGTESSWNGYLRTEIFSLLDLKIPQGITCNDDGDQPDQISLERAQDALANRTLILSAGAFQNIWEHRSRPALGFCEQKHIDEQTDLTHLVGTLPRELTNRFRNKLVVLPQLVEADYRRMLEMVGASMPAYLRETFFRLGNQRIPEALHCRQGCRFIEELILDVVMAERAVMRTNLALDSESKGTKDTEPDSADWKMEP